MGVRARPPEGAPPLHVSCVLSQTAQQPRTLRMPSFAAVLRCRGALPSACPCRPLPPPAIQCMIRTCTDLFFFSATYRMSRESQAMPTISSSLPPAPRPRRKEVVRSMHWFLAPPALSWFATLNGSRHLMRGAGIARACCACASLQYSRSTPHTDRAPLEDEAAIVVELLDAVRAPISDIPAHVGQRAAGEVSAGAQGAPHSGAAAELAAHAGGRCTLRFQTERQSVWHTAACCPRPATHTLPCESVVMPSGKKNWLGLLPYMPHDRRYVMSLVNFCTRALPLSSTCRAGGRDAVGGRRDATLRAAHSVACRRAGGGWAASRGGAAAAAQRPPRPLTKKLP